MTTPAHDPHGTDEARSTDSSKAQRPPEEGEPWHDERSIQIDGSVEDVWSAWAEPDHVRRWFSDHAYGALEPGAELVHVFEGHGEHRYQVLEVEAPHRLVLEGRMMDGAAFRQEVRIERNDGTTVLTLVHSGFGASDPEDEITKGIDSGWTMALHVMKYYVEHAFGRDKVSLPIFRPAQFDYEPLAQNHYFPEAARSEWLKLPAAVGRPLARTSHELLLEWPAAGGVLELKAFGSGPSARVAGLRAILWAGAGDDSVEPSTLEGELHASMDRLLARLE